MTAALPQSIHLANSEATLELGRKLAQTLPPNSVILLEGDLGAGKTTFVRGLAIGLGINEPILSPTFTLINEYVEGRLPLYHFDLYRLESTETAELFPETYWEGIEVDPGITAIEWAQRLPYKPPSYLNLQLEHTPTGERQATLMFIGLDNIAFAMSNE
ncbi:tRNA (adenosine(37)-N6)-threonylcarbamoyltransferase complex ATPase subunit type 1 TsaE [Oscillatoria sp. FACHB-1406]|uniref:tRNA (adenosine(37)-N6)-threonylcarbamoyltransferase complex ATPase subunit type 1 TsaE n=1 Tax=Oscillatoria sp. FACHB-1406 TaxID=2692846 RepID=UPI001689CB64|nr:tRNA (adenosine(37)-N6)-threonylcarbamoyltransferase complex ATPase subunit type 1 TsaE [Oscillatoria sp. FACHB-1406]MBD2578611.1 tRNA (adenosine(37)-N6)-threonylcarbamoyltransferase complex ATPase subunit type 1 TsaE [Oscillatoria sp. FACHB-1406]